MLRLLKQITCLALLAAGAQLSFGFALLGPINEPYQTQEIGYNLPGDIGAPKNLGEEYRRNMPVLYYTCDANFLDYFGSNGLAEVDKAFNVFNSLTNVSSYSSDLSEFPLETKRTNYKAESLYMFDLKSWVMSLLIESMGLAEPIRFTWTLHDRFLIPGGTCPFGEEYIIIKRNFDSAFGTSVDQLKPSSYVNNILYSYQIAEYCTAPANFPYIAVTFPFSVDPDANAFTPVASTFGFGNSFLFSPYGLFYTGITRDDVGGLRYLLRANNMNVENAGPGTLTLETNYVPQLLVSSNLSLLAAQAITNDAPTLQGLYPNLVILSTSNFFSNIFTTNITAYFTNFPWDPAGTPAHLAFLTNSTPSVATRYIHTFGNVLRLLPTANGWVAKPLLNAPTRPNSPEWVTVETDSVGASNMAWGPVGSTFITTNVFDQSYITNGVVGDYVILPTNLCDIGIVSSQLTNVVSSTNVVFVATNTFVSTNALGFTNAGTLLSYTQNLITYFTNHTFVIYPVVCDPTNVSLRQGIEKITFIRRDYDSLLTRFFYPITNDYTINTVTNNAIIPLRVRRVVTQPDFLLTAQDTVAGPDALPTVPAVRRDILYNTNSEYLGLAGPGTIEPATGAPAGTTFIFNKVGPMFINFGLVNTNAYLTEVEQIPIYIWGSFDASTNTPVIYPNDVSVSDLENQVLIQVTPSALPPGTLGTAYLGQLQTVGYTPNWQAPYSWSLAPGSPGLPPGLFITNPGDGSGVISGTPTTVGFYDFIIRVTDAVGRNLDRSFSINITPDP
ncbi:MAG TPA: Ig domain-containing protein [Verrucomicrobiae bacterium]|nr:Ig domain-containing protein [Verrucomicrobiae bacterium]